MKIKNQPDHMSKEKRNLSGIYFKVKNEEGKYENVVFEDLAVDQQHVVMEGRSEEWLKSLAVRLANTINELSEKFDITANNNSYMKPKEIFSEEQRKKLQKLINEGLIKTVYKNCFEALQIAESEIEEKENDLCSAQSLIKIGKDEILSLRNQLESKDKEIAELHTLLQAKLTEETNRDKAQKAEIAELKDIIIGLDESLQAISKEFQSLTTDNEILKQQLKDCQEAAIKNKEALFEYLPGECLNGFGKSSYCGLSHLGGCKKCN